MIYLLNILRLYVEKFNIKNNFLPTSNPKEGGCLPNPPYLTLKSTRLKFSISDTSSKTASLCRCILIGLAED